MASSKSVHYCDKRCCSRRCRRSKRFLLFCSRRRNVGYATGGRKRQTGSVDEKERERKSRAKGTCVFPLFLFIPISKKPQIANLSSPILYILYIYIFIESSRCGLMVCRDRYRTIISTHIQTYIIRIYLFIYRWKIRINMFYSVCVFTLLYNDFDSFSWWKINPKLFVRYPLVSDLEIIQGG